ncbi:NAD(P)-dependent oxidoreductase [Mucilaginibacter boryungensis]|uniref:NAD(P)-dependent oxidoreductase n=2 Tax=Mucilaginibacter boryungensis TaxID=768480 RepID=A0ABR9XE88_9SPHI|nr:NAD(P)-dependent oxidoreductase [Mucilaginibacter boryungensis]
MNVSLEALEQEMLKPSAALVNDIAQLDGDIIVLGAGGKMGPDLIKLALNAINAAGVKKKVIGVSRFSDTELLKELTDAGMEAISGDLLDERFLESLPEVPNVMYMAGTKFGTTGNESYTWAMNAYLPGRVAQKFRHSRIVAFSTGNIYPYSPISSGGCSEEQLPAPVGEYGQSCLGRERMFEHFSKQYQTPVLIYRLNYAIDFKYGVLLEIAKSVLEERPIDLATANVNVIWQGDANEVALRAFQHCSSPPKLLNVTGPETLSVEWVAKEFGHLFNKKPTFVNQPQHTALLSNAAECSRLFGYPKTSVKQMIALLAHWLLNGGKVNKKPTHFQEREGKY